MPASPARAAHGSRDVFVRVHDGAADWISRLRVPQPERASAPVQPTPEAEPSGVIRDPATDARLSLRSSEQRIRAALSLGCPQCGAPKGGYCYPSCGGFCSARWVKGIELSIASPLRPGELAGLAASARNARLHEAQAYRRQQHIDRERETEAQP